MKARGIVLVIVGVLILASGVGVGLIPVETYFGEACGSVIVRETWTIATSSCDDPVGKQKIFFVCLLVLGGATLAAGLVSLLRSGTTALPRQNPSTPMHAPQQPSIPQAPLPKLEERLARLAELHEAHSLTDEEFRSAKRLILDGH